MARIRVSYDIEVSDEKLDHDQDGLLDAETRAAVIAATQKALRTSDSPIMIFVLCGEEFPMGYPTYCTKEQGHDGDHGTMRS